ncbi:MAG: hypothetical protein JXR97_15520 [Planctomycetes bacterium]|nr:hypothetical protein [Planctomycetota bacterium]
MPGKFLRFLLAAFVCYIFEAALIAVGVMIFVVMAGTGTHAFYSESGRWIMHAGLVLISLYFFCIFFFVPKVVAENRRSISGEWAGFSSALVICAPVLYAMIKLGKAQSSPKMEWGWYYFMVFALCIYPVVAFYGGVWGERKKKQDELWRMKREDDRNARESGY